MAETTLTLLYTANFNGRLDFTPRMATLIQRERANAPGPVLLLDGGSLCSIDVWPCAVTKMRAGRTMLEAMGYDAAALAGTDLLPLGGMSEGSEAVMSEMAAHGIVSALNASFGWVPSMLPYAIVERDGLRIGVTADWRPPAEDVGGLPEGNVLAQPDPDEVGVALEALGDEADLIILMTLHAPSQPLPGAHITLWPDGAQSLDQPPALAVRQYALPDVQLVSEQVLVCDESVPQEPTIAAVLELVIEEAARQRGP